jgi:TP901 family phage tail tape measure protein
MAEADAKLLFGVAMAGDEEGDSEKQIKEDLKTIIDRINKKGLKVQIGLEAVGDGKGGRQSWNTIVRKKLEELSKGDKFSVKISKIDITGSAIKDFKDQLSRVISTMTLDKTVSVTLGTPTGDIAGETKKIAENAEEAAEKLARFKAEFGAVGQLSARVGNAVNTATNNPAMKDHAAAIDTISKRYAEWYVEVDKVKNAGTFGEGGRAGLLSRGKEILADLQALTGETASLAKNTVKVANEADKAAENLKKWTAAKNGKASAAYKEYEQDAAAMKILAEGLQNGTKSLEDFNAQYPELHARMSQNARIIRENGEATKSWGDKLGGLAKKFTQWFGVSQIIMRLYRTLKQMVSVVIEIDTAMTELKKVTDETATTYDRFLTNAASRAKELGTTISDIVTATANFARLGYNITDASTLADVAVVYKNVGDGIENISDASESIISTMKAFGISANDAMSIVDKFNEVGNNFAISSKGVGDALLRSASAMHAAGNDIDETIALATAANTIVQSPEKVGTTLKTISMFLRSAKTELEEAGEDTEGMAESVSKLRGNILALTGNRVDIQETNDTYKSTTQILRELSQVWGELTDVTRANILEMIGGKRNANVTAALIENFQLVEDVIKTSQESAGSALRENAKYMESIQGHIARFKAAFQDLSKNFIDSSSVKFAVDFGKVLVNILNIVAKLINYFGGLKTVLAAVVGIVVALHAKRIINTIKGVPVAINNITTSLQEMAARATTANWIVLGLTAALTVFLAISSRVREERQKATDAMNEAAQKANEERESLDKLIVSYKALATSGIDTDDKREEARNIQEQITELVGKQADNLDLVNGKLENELEILRGISAEAAAQERDAVETALLRAEAQSRAGLNAEGSGTRPWYTLGTFNEGLVGNATYDILKYDLGNPDILSMQASLDHASAEEALAYYKEVQDLLLSNKEWMRRFDEESEESGPFDVYGGSSGVLSRIQERIDFLQDLLDKELSARRAMARIDLAGKDFSSQSEFDNYIHSVETATDKTDGYKQVLIEMANQTFPQFDREAQAAAEAAEREAEAAQKAAEANERAMMMNDPVGYVQSQFDGVADAISSVREAMEPLAKLQEEVADGFTMSIDKAMEFAKVYPEILNGAQVAADGQITLNEEIVKSFIDGKRQEIGAELDKQIATLEAERETYEGQLALAQAELDYLKQAASGKIQTTREETQFRLLCAKEEAEAMIEGGATSEEAYRIAAQHMSDASYDFADVALRVAKNIDENFEASSGAIKGNFVSGVQRAMQALVGMTKQAHHTARAVAGIATGDAKAGSEELIQINGGPLWQGRVQNSRGSGYKSITREDYVADRARHGAEKITSELRDRLSDFFNSSLGSIDEEIGLVETDISNYEQAISMLDGRIAALRAAKEIGVSKSNGSKTGSGSSGSSSTSSSDKELDRLKSIVSLLETELKLLEAQDAPAKDRIDKIREIQGALMDEINYLKSIGGDQETINNLTLQWLNYQKEIDDIYSSTTDAAKSALDDLVKYRVKMMEDELKRQKDNLDKQLDALKDFYDRQKQLLRDQNDEDKYLEEQAEKRKKVADLEAQLEQLRFDDSAWAQKRRAELEEELAKARKELDDYERDHALSVTEKALDEQYEKQVKELEKEKDAIDNTLGDEQSLYQQAFNDILAGGDDLYQALIDWNKKYGDHIDETITKAWENAWKALKDYKDLYGEDYQGVQLGNVTGASNGGGNGGSSGGSKGGSSGGSGGGTSSGGSGGGSGSSAAVLTDDVKRKVAAAIWNGSYGWGNGNDRANKLKEVFGDKNGIQELVNKGVGKKDKAPSRDYTYLNMRKKFRGYYTGTRSATPGWHALDERGAETTFEAADGTRYKLFTGGEKVLNATASNFLYDFATGGKRMLFDMVRAMMGRIRGEIIPPVNRYEINAGDIIIQGNADRATVSEIRRARRDSVELILKEFDRLGK